MGGCQGAGLRPASAWLQGLQDQHGLTPSCFSFISRWRSCSSAQRLFVTFAFCPSELMGAAEVPDTLQDDGEI